jgi:hypothetical protein
VPVLGLRKEGEEGGGNATLRSRRRVRGEQREEQREEEEEEERGRGGGKRTLEFHHSHISPHLAPVPAKEASFLFLHTWPFMFSKCALLLYLPCRSIIGSQGAPGAAAP